MTELTLESLAQRVAALEKDLAEQKAKADGKKDWRRVAGMFTGSEFMKQVDAEGQAIREAERKAAREEPES
jgi:hypothetical protein